LIAHYCKFFQCENRLKKSSISLLSTTRRGRIIDGSSYSLFSFQGTMSFSSCLVSTRCELFVFVCLSQSLVATRNNIPRIVY